MHLNIPCVVHEPHHQNERFAINSQLDPPLHLHSKAKRSRAALDAQPRARGVKEAAAEGLPARLAAQRRVVAPPAAPAPLRRAGAAMLAALSAALAAFQQLPLCACGGGALAPSQALQRSDVVHTRAGRVSVKQQQVAPPPVASLLPLVGLLVVVIVVAGAATTAAALLAAPVATRAPTVAAAFVAIAAAAFAVIFVRGRRILGAIVGILEEGVAVGGFKVGGAARDPLACCLRMRCTSEVTAIVANAVIRTKSL